VSHTILIVDDDPGIRTALQRALSTLPHTVRLAADIDEARVLLDAEPISLVLLDLRMPRGGGMELLRELAAGHPEIRVAILTAHGTVENAVNAMKLGAVDFVQKPFSADQIREHVERMLARDAPDPERVRGYEALVEAARRLIDARSFATAREKVQQAIAARPREAAEAYNLLGVLEELRGDRVQAQSDYRIALDMDPGYQPAAANLRRSMKPPEERDGGLTLA
jgi:two-component system, OmpR family, alkaline phosphatase synthesis response regulator PhoP